MKPIRLPFAALALVGAIALAGCETTPTETPSDLDGLHGDHSGHVMTAAPAAPPAHGAPDLAMIRAGSAPYRNVDRAAAAGFVPVHGCVSAPPGTPFTGAMGHHYVNFERFANLEIDPSKPEILLYIPNAQGRMELVGVEFAVDAVAWHEKHGDDVFPEVAGVRYDPPNPMADEGSLPNIAYTLHVWNWAENPDGMFAPFNPNLSCPAG